MFNVNLNNKPGIQSDKISSSRRIDLQLDKKNEANDSLQHEQSHEKVRFANNAIFIFVMLLFVIVMILLIYFKGEILFLNDLIDELIIKVQNNISYN